jgi:glycosyltransferase involved in cell wall biosynthesis
MRTGIITFGGDGGKSGISHYIIKLLEQFALIPDGPDFEVIGYEDEKDIFVPPNGRMSSFGCGGTLRNPVLNVAWHQIGLPQVCRKRGYDILFFPAANRRMSFWAPCPSVGTVHDFSSIHVEGKYDPARMVFIKRLTPVLIRRLNMVLTVSEASKRDIVDFCRIPEERVVVTPNGVDFDIYYPRDREASLIRVQQRYGVRAPYILYVSRIEHPGKNHVRLIRAFGHLKAKLGIPHQLVLAGSPWSRAKEVERVAAESPYSDDIAFIGFVASADLPALYSAADLFSFPSLFEGFGMPILEAMACGNPVTCSNVSAMPEVVGDAGLLFDPYSEEDIGSTMERMLTDENLKQRCIREGIERSRQFTWANTARKTLEVIQQTWEASR